MSEDWKTKVGERSNNFCNWAVKQLYWDLNSNPALHALITRVPATAQRLCCMGGFDPSARPFDPFEKGKPFDPIAAPNAAISPDIQHIWIFEGEAIVGQ